MTPIHAIIVEALAQADALFEPVRDPHAKFWAATHVLRWRFHGHDRYGNSGLPYRGDGSKDRERDLAEASRLGLVVRRRARSKTVSLRLTPPGLAEARRLTGDHPHACAIVWDEFERHAPQGTWIPEIAFTGGVGWGDGRKDELKRIQSRHRPAMVAGLVESNVLTTGGLCYRLLPGKVRPETPEGFGEIEPPEPDPEAVDLYSRVYPETIAWLDAQTAESVGARGEIGELPLAPGFLEPYRELPDSVLPAPELPRYADGSPVPGWSFDPDNPRRLVFDRAAADEARRLFLARVGALDD